MSARTEPVTGGADDPRGPGRGPLRGIIRFVRGRGRQSRGAQGQGALGHLMGWFVVSVLAGVGALLALSAVLRAAGPA